MTAMYWTLIGFGVVGILGWLIVAGGDTNDDE